jgi:NTE family protein
LVRVLRLRISGALLALGLLLAGCASSPVLPEPPAAPAPGIAQARAPAVLGLALGGGAARGFAHIGVLQVLDEAGIKPGLVVGTSAGSLVGAIYASGKSGVQLQQVALGMDEAAITDWTLPFFNRGVLRGEALGRYVSAQVAGKTIEEMPLPLGIVATDLQSGEGILFRRGDVATAVRASSAVPAVFTPVRINGREYVDGGLVAPVPARYARQMGADVVLAVDISSAPEGNATGGMLQVLLQTFAIMGRSINSYALKDADLVVRPALSGVGSSDFKDRQRSIDAGRAAMQAALPQLRALLAQAGRDPH